MRVHRESWFSPNTGRDMPVVRFGDRGPALIYIPSSSGDETEFERYGMPEACAPRMREGRVQVFSVDGFGPRSLFDADLGSAERIRSYARFERYVREELVPWTLDRAQNPYLGVVGPSYGAFVAANLLFKLPGQVRVAGGLGGVYAHWHRLDGYHDDDVYFHTPQEYLPRLSDPSILGAIRATRGLLMFGAERDPWLHSTHDLARVLSEKRLPHGVEIWPAPADHSERWWRLQIRRFLDRCF